MHRWVTSRQGTANGQAKAKTYVVEVERRIPAKTESEEEKATQTIDEGAFSCGRFSHGRALIRTIPSTNNVVEVERRIPAKTESEEDKATQTIDEGAFSCGRFSHGRALIGTIPSRNDEDWCFVALCHDDE
jgi:hypothetical protein